MNLHNIRILRKISNFKPSLDFEKSGSLTHSLYLWKVMARQEQRLYHTAIRLSFPTAVHNCGKGTFWHGSKVFKSNELYGTKLKYWKFKEFKYINTQASSLLTPYNDSKQKLLHKFGNVNQDPDVKIRETIVEPSVDDTEVKTHNIEYEDMHTKKRREFLKTLSEHEDIMTDDILPMIYKRKFRTSSDKSLPQKEPVSAHEDVKGDNVLSMINKNTLHAPSNENLPQKDGNNQNNLGKPSKEQLAKVYHTLSEELPSLFVKSMNYTIYSKDLIFENRIKGSRTVGLFPYIKQTSMLRIIGHIKYAFVKFEILKITQHAEDSTIRVRWRIIGISALKSLPMIFTLKSYTMKDAKEKMDDWYDGFSTFHVGPDGLVYKHIADKMMPDEERLVKKPTFASKLAALIGMAPKTPAASQPAVTSSRAEDFKGKSFSTGTQKKVILTLLISDTAANLM